VKPSVTAYAPGGVGNVGPGLDILGLALAGAGDSVRAEWSDLRGIHILDPGHPELPREPERHASGLAARAVLERVKNHPELGSRGIALKVTKGLPLSGGQGGSAASAVAGAVAVNTLLGQPLDSAALVAACLTAEEIVSGRHADNIVTSLLGGIVLIRCLDPLDVIKLPVPEELWVVVVRPHQRVRTADARAVLPDMIPRAVALHQAAQVGSMVAALASSDYQLLGRAIDDRIAEPARAGLLPGFREAKAAALKAGALGCSISGAGPSVFALIQGRGVGVEVEEAMKKAYQSCGLPSESRVVRVDTEGARVVTDGKDSAP
jgi:homoserine kinase